MPAPILKGRVVVKFPANVVAGNGITITKEGQTYTIATDATPLQNLSGAGAPTMPALQGTLYFRVPGPPRVYINLDGQFNWAVLLN